MIGRALAYEDHRKSVFDPVRRRNVVPSGLWAYASYSRQNATEDGERMSNSPHHLLKGGISTTPWAKLHGGIELAYESGRETLAGTMTGSSVLLNGIVSYAIGPHVRLKASVRNALNETISMPGGPELRQTAITQDGRTFALQLSLTK
ncbi:MAG TPA: TonB-dependent receptor [Thermoanaerobaculia bacterium]|nr:TonB-dependent receptor [Thermoanaerobaculia bacterium]